MKQADSQAIFQTLNGMAHGGAGDPQQIGSTPKAAVLGDRHEGFEIS
ncbi:hypothetical protein BN1221_01602c [Brenneria goodwinii]|uniref:Uncharacterized protein n=1 Tax=Brenneria goodwinii TaxID=1109412 RepID=A0A0G4JTB0_9GAMM|nr:hypothetical protein BN1221_01602c [Brenneria goodwinii]